MNGMKLRRSWHIAVRLDRSRAVWCDSRVLMIRTTSGFLEHRLMKQRSSRMSSFFATMCSPANATPRWSIFDPLLVHERSSRLSDKWRAQQRAPLLALQRRLRRMRALGLLMRLLLRFLFHHRPRGLGVSLSRRLVSSLHDDEGYISSTSLARSFFQMV